MSHLLRLAVAAACTFALTAVLACRPASTGPPNLILVTIDTLRADRLTAYGYEAARTPTIQALADDGIVFENAYADTTWTIPSVSSLMTGRYPFEHGVQTLHDRLSVGPTLAELLRDAGYRTAAIVGSFPLDRRFGFSRGFDEYDDEMNTPFQLGPSEEPREEWFEGSPSERERWYLARLRDRSYRPDNEVADRAIAWLRENSSEPFFLWVHFFGPHEKRHVPVHRLRDHAIATYDRDVGFADRQLSRVLDTLAERPYADRTAIVLHSDHGQTLDDHPVFGHGLDLYDSTARIPLIVRLPGRERAGERVSRVVRNVDIFPTLLALAGLEPTVPGSGRSLLDEGASGVLADTAYIETLMLGRGPSVEEVEIDGEVRRVGHRLRGIRDGRWKLVVKEPIPAWGGQGDDGRPLPADFVESARSFELYDLLTDPAERRNLAAAEPERVESLRARLDQHTPRSTSSGDGEAAGAGAELDEQARERLRALGYLE